MILNHIEIYNFEFYLKKWEIKRILTSILSFFNKSSIILTLFFSTAADNAVL